MNKVTLDTKVLDKIIEKFPDEASEIVRKAAFNVEGYAKMKAAVDTGAMMNSIYTVTEKLDGYTVAASKAKKANPKVETSPHPEPKDRFTAHVGPCVEYGIYVELGHYLRNGDFVSAKPFLLPALLSVEPWFMAQWHKLFEAL